MINNEKTILEIATETAPKPKPRAFPVAILVRSRKRYQGESYEDYKVSMKILGKAQKLMGRYGSQHTLYFDQESGRILGL